MDYEKKYKALVEAVKTLKEANPSDDGIQNWVKDNVPELKESDERIREELLEHCINRIDGKQVCVDASDYRRWADWLFRIDKENTSNVKSGEVIRNEIIKFLELPHPQFVGKRHQEEWIAWLEKQGEKKSVDSLSQQEAMDIAVAKCFEQREQKLTDKVEPKFHDGQWITNGDYTWKIVEVKPLDYILQSQDGNIVDDTISHVDAQFHSFTIQDAKDGDVLACESGWTCIFKTLVNDETFSSYCFMDNTKWFCETGSEGHTLKEEFVKAYNGKISPATKEQRDILFQKMKEAGYEWNAEKKGLKKIEHKSAECLQETNPNGGIVCEDFREGDGYYKVNLAYLSKSQVEFIENLVSSWQTPANNTAEWSEEDKWMLQNILECLRHGWKKLPTDILKYESWLKSLRPQNRWKPSKEQMDALDSTLQYSQVSHNSYEHLNSLFNDLKKLKE